MRYKIEPIDQNRILIHVDRELPASEHVCYHCGSFGGMTDEQVEALRDIAEFAGVLEVRTGRYSMLVTKATLFDFEAMTKPIIERLRELVNPNGLAIPFAEEKKPPAASQPWPLPLPTLQIRRGSEAIGAPVAKVSEVKVTNNPDGSRTIEGVLKAPPAQPEQHGQITGTYDAAIDAIPKLFEDAMFFGDAIPGDCGADPPLRDDQQAGDDDEAGAAVPKQ